MTMKTPKHSGRCIHCGHAIVADNALPLKMIEELNEKMGTRGLLWPAVYESLGKVTLVDP